MQFSSPRLQKSSVRLGGKWGMEDTQFVHRYLDAWNSRDAAALASLFGERGTYQDPYCRGVLKGGLAVAEHAKAVFRAFDPLHFEPLTVAVTADGQATLHYRVQATNVGPLGEFPATGRSIDATGLVLLASHSNRLVSAFNYYDRTTVGQQLGHPEYRRLRGLGTRSKVPYVVINPFRVPRDDQDDLVRRWEDLARLLRKQPGFVDARLHRSIDPDAWFPFVSATFWKSPKDFEKALSLGEVLRLVAELRFDGYPALYRIEVKF